MSVSHPLDVLGLSNRARNALLLDEDRGEWSHLKEFRKGDRITPEELARVPNAQLLIVRALGGATLFEIRRALAAYEIRLVIEASSEWADAFRVACFGEGA